jgi:hypothetical protein
MGLGKFPHTQPDMGIPAVSYCYHGDGSWESIPDGDLPIAILACKHALAFAVKIKTKASSIVTLWSKTLLRLCLVGEKFLRKMLHRMFHVMLKGVFGY